MLATLGNTDIEKAIKAKKKADELKSKEENQQTATKLRLKKQAENGYKKQILAHHASQLNKKDITAIYSTPGKTEE